MKTAMDPINTPTYHMKEIMKRRRRKPQFPKLFQTQDQLQSSTQILSQIQTILGVYKLFKTWDEEDCGDHINGSKGEDPFPRMIFNPIKLNNYN